MSRTRRTMRVALILAACIATGSGQGLPLPHRPAFPFLPKPGANAAALQALAPGYADAAGMAPSMEEVQYPALAPAPLGTGQPVIPGSAPRPAPGPLSPYNPIFNPIISKSDPSTQSSTSMQAQGQNQFQTVTANSNGQVTTSPTTYSNNGASTGSMPQYSSNTQQNGNQNSATYGQGGNTQQSGTNSAYGTQNGQTNQMGYLAMPAPAPAPVTIGQTNSMVHAVELAHEKAQTTPQLSFGQDGVTVQQPIVNNPDGIVSGGNQFKVNEHGVILGNVGTGGSVQLANDGGVTIDPGTAGNLWNLARSAAQLYGRKLQEHTA